MGALALTLLPHGLVFGVSTLDAFSFTVAVVVLATASPAASWLPGAPRRASGAVVALHEQ